MSALEEIGQTAAAAKDDDQTDERPMFVKGLTKEEEDMSDAERIAYLRERGIQIDLSPQEQVKADAARKAKNPQPGDLVPCFKYVKIPCDGGPFEEHFALLPLAEGGMVPAGDNMPAMVKPFFSGRSKGINEEVLGEHARATLGEEAAKLTPRAFEEATLNGSVETFALVRPAEANGFAGVYMYLDEIGVIKELPPNPRGNMLASQCGHPSVSFFGDLYLGRVCTQPAPMRNGDFCIKDLDSGADWVKTAPAENYQYSMSMKEVEKALNSKGNSQHVKLGGFEEGDMPGGEGGGGKGKGQGADSEGGEEGGDGGGGDDGRDENGDSPYVWTQTKDDIEVCIPIPAGTRAKDLRVTIKRSSLHVCLAVPSLASKLLEVPKLNGQVDVDDSTWFIDQTGAHTDGQARVVITLLKAGAGSIWRLLRADGAD